MYLYCASCQPAIDHTIKIGISNQSDLRRLSQFNCASPRPFAAVSWKVDKDCEQWEARILKAFSEFIVIGPYGNSEQIRLHTIPNSQFWQTRQLDESTAAWCYHVFAAAGFLLRQINWLNPLLWLDESLLAYEQIEGPKSFVEYRFKSTTNALRTYIDELKNRRCVWVPKGLSPNLAKSFFWNTPIMEYGDAMPSTPEFYCSIYP